MNEEQMKYVANLISQDLEKDKDYRVRKKEVVTGQDLEGNPITEEVSYCTINEILEYNARVYNDEVLLSEALEEEKYNFLSYGDSMFIC